jgi:O-antigen biosynthesis protein
MGLLKSIKFYLKKSRQIKNLQTKKVISTFREQDNNIQKELVFNTSFTPTVSIIIPFYNQLNYTYNCLNYLHKNEGSQYKYEIILIDDNSTANINLSIYKGIRTIKNKENVGFVKSINVGIRESVGEYIYILNNDTEVQKGFLDELLYVFDNFSNVGAAGSKLLNANGTLQEAGAVVLKNCAIQNIFPKKDFFYPDINYIRKVDYCSGCSLLFKRESDNGDLNLFDEQFAPAYFEETDLCFQLKYLQNKEIYYTPFSEVVHFNGVTYNAPKNSVESKLKQKKELFKTNLEKFKNKWKKQIDAIQATTVPERINEIYNNKSLVVFCGVIPAHDRDSGSNRLKEIIQGYIELGYHVSIVKNKTFFEESDYFTYYQRLGVDVYFEHKISRNLEHYLQKNYSKAKIAWFYNSDVFIKYYKIAQKYLPKAALIYDMVDIHHLRFKRALELEPNHKIFQKEFIKYTRIEKEAANLADYVITISDFEEKYMQQFCDSKKIITISNIHYIKIKLENTFSFEDRKDILFIGSMHPPNIDALHFLYNDIMPLVWNKLPDLKVNVIGNVKNCIKEINNPNFVFLGFVPDISTYFCSNKLMVAPLRYGAGVKGKIGQSFEYYLPVVMTTIGAEGMQLFNRENALIDDDKVGFANSIIELYTNKELWLKLQGNSEMSLKPFSKEKLKEQIIKIKEK